MSWVQRNGPASPQVSQTTSGGLANSIRKAIEKRTRSNVSNEVPARAFSFRRSKKNTEKNKIEDAVVPQFDLTKIPSEKDRMMLLRAVMDAADRVHKRREWSEEDAFIATTAGSTAISNYTAQKQKVSRHRQTKRYRIRLTRVLQDQLVPAAATSLKLLDRDENKPCGYDENQMICLLANAALVEDGNTALEDTFSCIVLLLSNIVLLYGEKYGGYDARIRYIVRMACVDMLCTQMEADGMLEQMDISSDQVIFGTDHPDAVNALSAVEEEEAHILSATDNESAEGEAEKSDQATAITNRTKSTDDTSIQDDLDEMGENPEGNQDLVSEDAESLDEQVENFSKPENPQESSDEEQSTSSIDTSSDNGDEVKSSSVAGEESPSNLESYMSSPDGSESDESDNVSECSEQEEVEEEAKKGLDKEEKETEISKEEQQRGRLRYIANRKFQSLEREIAARIFATLAAIEGQQKRQEKETAAAIAALDAKEAAEAAEERKEDGDFNEIEYDDDVELNTSLNLSQDTRKRMKKLITRGFAIGSVGLAMGTIFAITGGLAAPALAAGIAGLGIASGSAVATTTIALLTTVKAVTAIFGVGGGGLAAYKMKKRTDGLTEFRIRRENVEQNMYEGADDATLRRGIEATLPQLSTVICVSGWLKDHSDYQRPWGIQPTDPPIADKLELLKRFYTVYDPSQVETVEESISLLRKKHKKTFTYDRLWMALKKRYGRDPDHLLPLDRPNTDAFSLSQEEQEVVGDLLEGVVMQTRATRQAHVSTSEDDTDTPHNQAPSSSDQQLSMSSLNMSDSNVGVNQDFMPKLDVIGRNDSTEDFTPTENSNAIEGGETNHPQSKVKEVPGEINATSDASELKKPETPSGGVDQVSNEAPKDIAPRSVSIKPVNLQLSTYVKPENDDTLVVWDWNDLWGGDIHTVTWESKTLQGLSHIATNMAKEVSTQATKQAIQYTAFVGVLFAAVAVPSALMTVSQLIDDPYQLVILRADAAGRELAKCLLESEERRPVTLMGFSFGARVIYSCLIELARHQELWEEQQEREEMGEEIPENAPTNKLDGDPDEYLREPASIVEDVVFMGLPRLIDNHAMWVCRQIVGGRLVNCYNQDDWLLPLMFLSRGGTKTGGTHPVDAIPGIENYNVTHLVKAHAKYGDAVPSILQLVSSM